jgi:hypothetical protein
MQIRVHIHRASSRPAIVVILIVVAIFLALGVAGLLRHDPTMAMCGGGAALWFGATFLTQAWYESRKNPH